MGFLQKDSELSAGKSLWVYIGTKGKYPGKVEPRIAFQAGDVCAVQVAGSMPKCYFCWSLYYPDVFLFYQYVSRFIQLLIELMDCSRELLLLKVCFFF